MKSIIGKIKLQKKCCSCGETLEGICGKCKTEALDIVVMDDIIAIDEGYLHGEIFTTDKR